MRRHKSAFCSVQLSVPDLLKDWINNCPLHFQDKPLKWAAVQKQNTPYSIFVVLRTVQTSQVFIFPTVSQTHLINAASVTLGVSVWAPVSNFNKFTAIENDAPGFQLFPLLWEETSCCFFGGNELFCTFAQLYQMLHNSGLQLPQRSGPLSGSMFNVSLHMRSSGKLFSWWCQQVGSLESTLPRQYSPSAVRIIDHLPVNGPGLFHPSGKATQRKASLHEVQPQP